MRLLRNLVILLIVIAMFAAGALFALQNTQPVPLDLLVYSFEPHSLALWLLSAFALGGLAGMLASSLIILRLRTSRAAADRKLRSANAELDRLRTTGLAGGE
jgi:lipopolysaccharide assembly protein A